MFVIVLLTSCPIKSSIKSLIGVQINTVKGGKMHCPVPADNRSEQCTELIDSGNTRSAFAHRDFLLPGDVLKRTLFYPFNKYGYLRLLTIRHRSQMAVRTVPIFLQYQTLRI